jgi:hypothetical protein
MADRIEREIEEILARLDDLPGDGQSERRPVSIAAQRETRRPSQPAWAPKRTRRALHLPHVSPATFLIVGAGAIIGGLILSNVWGPLIWAALAGVFVFLAGFVASFFQHGRPSSGTQTRGHYWRDRYIEYTPQQKSPLDRLRRRFRRR